MGETVHANIGAWFSAFLQNLTSWIELKHSQPHLSMHVLIEVEDNHNFNSTESKLGKELSPTQSCKCLKIKNTLGF